MKIYITLAIITCVSLQDVQALSLNTASVKSENVHAKVSRCQPQLLSPEIRQQSRLSSEKTDAILSTDHESERYLLTDDTLELEPPCLSSATKKPASFSAGGLHSRRKRSVNLDSFNNAEVRKVLELVVVAEAGHVATYGGPENVTTRIQRIVNYVNGVYQPFGLRIVLTKIVTLTNSTFNLNQTSKGLVLDFGVYKMFNVDVRHDAAILLISSLMRKDATSGLSASTPFLAWTNGLCQMFQSTAVVSDVGEPMQAAWFMAHTIGSLLGFKNVEDVPGCSCPALNGCAMSTSLASEYSTRLVNWDTCSVDSWSSQVDAIWRSCLKDAPNASYPYTAATRCGNGIVDSGEQCDCGPALTCKSTCCDPSTCLLKVGAECASGSCCNANTCRLKPRGQVCRDTEGPCDVAETCDGATEWCPIDDRVSDGVVCAPNASFCYKGECKSRDSQCKVLFDASATVANDVCFTNINVLTSAGFCQKTLASANATNMRYTTVRCTPGNAMCGLLHCTMPSSPTVGDTYTIGTSSCSSQWGIDFASSGLRSPAMVPDGASCGTNLMCVNSSCEKVSNFSCSDCPDCHGNGVTTRGKLCYCRPGFAPPDCSSAGCGGSLTSPMTCDGLSTVRTSPLDTSTTKPVLTQTSDFPISPTILILVIAIVVPVTAIALVTIAAVVIVKKRSQKAPKQNENYKTKDGKTSTGVYMHPDKKAEDLNSIESNSGVYDYPHDAPNLKAAHTNQ